MCYRQQGDVLMTVSKANFTLWSTSDWTQKRTLPRSPTYAIPLALNPEADSFVITSSGSSGYFASAPASPSQTLPTRSCPSSTVPPEGLQPSVQAMLSLVTAMIDFGHGTPVTLKHACRT